MTPVLIKSIEFDPILSLFNIRRDHLYEVVGESISSGEPYVLMCRRCGDFEVCLFLQASPLGGDEYRVLFHGVIVSVSHDKQLDRDLEYVFRLTDTVRSVKGRVYFYIPRNISVKAYRFLCGSAGLNNVYYRILPVEEAMIYLG